MSSSLIRLDFILFGKLIHRAVELCIMFNCLYMALWATNFIYIAESMDLSLSWSIGSQFLMCVHLCVFCFEIV